MALAKTNKGDDTIITVSPGHQKTVPTSLISFQKIHCQSANLAKSRIYIAHLIIISCFLCSMSCELWRQTYQTTWSNYFEKYTQQIIINLIYRSASNFLIRVIIAGFGKTLTRSCLTAETFKVHVWNMKWNKTNILNNDASFFLIYARTPGNVKHDLWLT